MMTTTNRSSVLDEAGRRYVDRASAGLEGLAVGEREELLSDIVDAIAELDGPVAYDDLVARLGEPDAFARELRESSGVAARQDGESPSRAVDAGPGWTERAVEQLGRLTEWMGRDFEPLWWVVRALGVAFVLIVFGMYVDGGFVLLTLVLIGGSIAWGVRARRRRAEGGDERGARLRGVGLLLLGLVVVWALAVFATNNGRPVYVDGDGSGYYPAEFASGLGRSGGEEITNIYAFDATGKRIEDVRLFDQAGDPINIGGVSADGTTPDGECCFDSNDVDVNEAGEVRFRVLDDSNRELFNVFPIRYASSKTGVVADPGAGWPQAPRPLVTAPSLAAAQAQDEIEAEVERRVAERLKAAKSKSAMREKRAGTRPRSAATAPSPKAPTRGTRGR